MMLCSECKLTQLTGPANDAARRKGSWRVQVQKRFLCTLRTGKKSAMNLRALFYQHLAPTSTAPLALEITKARGNYLWDREGRKYLDLIAGISVCNVGHCHPKVVKAVKKQAGQYLHLLVYGELIESPQVKYARLLADYLPAPLESVYFTNSGAEATEGAMKLAKRATGRTQIIAFKQSYHGSTQGALSIMGDEYWRNAYRPLLPDILHLDYNDPASLDFITSRTACVIAETIQAERGVVAPDNDWMKALRQKCSEAGALLVLDEIQTGFGRTGSLWGFDQFGIVPDIVLLGKALGGGMPLGAFVASRQLMSQLAENPVLGHITTFGGHPVSCAAGMAALKVLLEEELVQQVQEKEALFLDLLGRAGKGKIRSGGLLMALELDSDKSCQKLIKHCLDKGLLTDWFLFAPDCLRIAPPLTISRKQIKQAAEIIVQGLHA